jgi:hypothetical protein
VSARGIRIARRAPLACVAVAALALTGCSALPFGHKHPVAPEPPPAAVAAPADTAAKPVAPDTAEVRPVTKRPLGLPASRTKSPAHPAAADSVAALPQPVTPAETMDPEERARTLSRTVADTTSAGQALRRCSGRAVMPDQEATLDAVRSLLAQTRAALASGELWRAESLARKARQLASSLNCP